MNELDKAIKFTKRNIEMCERFEKIPINIQQKREFPTLMHKTILSAIEEKQQREGKCKYCGEQEKEAIKDFGGFEVGIVGEKLIINNYHRYFSYSAEIIYCPMCGRRLKNDISD